ncbi:MAG: class 1 fructose-bisphosphatase [Bacteroidota bacterium]
MQKEVNNITPDLGPSLEQFLCDEQQRFPHLPKALLPILSAIAAAGREVNDVVRKLDLTGIVGSRGARNFSGDEQQHLDMMAHHCFVRMLVATQEVCAVISEEAEGILAHTNLDSHYVVALDPLDGSPNIAVNAAIGTLFSIYQRRSARAMPVQPEDVLQAGSHQLAAGYVLYGTSTMLVYTARHGVHGFTYEPSMDRFFLAHQAMHMPHSGHIYAANDGHFDTFPDYVQRYILQCRSAGYTARYMGALVADFHRHLIQGGIYLYPPTRINPAGKLRLMLECNALALIAEQAGGVASSGQQDILTIQPHAIHQRVPLYIGSSNMVQHLLAERKA